MKDDTQPRQRYFDKKPYEITFVNYSIREFVKNSLPIIALIQC